MKKNYLLFIVYIFIICDNVNAQLTKVIYAPPATEKVLGISNVVNFNGKFTMTVGSVPISQPTGYPDVTLWASKGYLLNEDGLIANGQFNTGHLGGINTGQFDTGIDIKITTDNKLGMMYQYPTGNTYGFWLPYKVWNGTSYEQNQFVSSQIGNIGSRLRFNYVNDDIKSASFMNAGYALLYHERLAGTWDNYQITNFGTILEHVATAVDGNAFYILLRVYSVSPSQIVLLKIENGTLTNQSVTTTSTAIYDFKIYNNNFYSLYSTGNNIVLSQKNITTGTTWTTETIVSETDITKASISFDNSNTPYVAYQTGITTNNFLKILKKNTNTWDNIFTSTHTQTFDAAHWSWGREPSILQRNGDIFAVYADNRQVYLTNTNLKATGLASSNIAANSVSLSYNSTNWATFYKIFRNGVEVGTSNTLNFSDANLIERTTYNYSFQACNTLGCTSNSQPISITTSPAMLLTEVKIENKPYALPNFQAVKNCGKKIAFKIKNTSNNTQNQTIKITIDNIVIFEQVNISFLPNEEKLFDETWVGDGMPNSSGIVFGGANYSSSLGTHIFSVYACSSVVCGTVASLLTTPQNYLSASTSINNPQNFVIVDADITLNNTQTTIDAPALLSSNAINIVTNTNYTLTSNQSWVTILGANTGQGNSTFTFSAEENTDVSARQASITITGCGVTKLFTIIQNGSVNVLIPTLFSPNNDGKNDVFLLRGNGIVAVDITILNKNNIEVWRTTDTREATDIGWRGENTPDGVYICNAKVTLSNGEVKNISKNIQILR
ncbi:MAG: hypothetical protein EAZ20_02860 [Bacteroidetes bacterium]|nr:MAG: hypothetical protein EAZ20_02860 [Bacteroidota bacterium]